MCVSRQVIKGHVCVGQAALNCVAIDYDASAALGQRGRRSGGAAYILDSHIKSHRKDEDGAGVCGASL